jgi:hypothetical protein
MFCLHNRLIYNESTLRWAATCCGISVADVIYYSCPIHYITSGDRLGCEAIYKMVDQYGK